MKKAFCILVVALHLAACTTLSTVGYPDGSFRAGDVHVGDNVVVTTASHQEFQFAVTSVSAGEICGAARCFDTREVAWVQRREIDWPRIAAFGVAALFGVVWGLARVYR